MAEAYSAVDRITRGNIRKDKSTFKNWTISPFG
jgi:hypothetical protein